VKVARSATYGVGVGVGVGLTEGDGIGAGVGVVLKRISAGVAPGSRVSMKVRVLAAVPVSALAVVFVPAAAFVPNCVAPVGLRLEPPFPAAALIIPIA